MDDLIARDELGLVFQYISLFNLQPFTPTGLTNERCAKSGQTGRSEPFIILKAHFGFFTLSGRGVSSFRILEGGSCGGGGREGGRVF